MRQKDPITQLLQQWSGGDAKAEAALFEILEKELKRLCHLILKRNPSPLMTFQTTEVFNELYMRLSSQTKDLEWRDRRHFFGISARLVRQLLIDSLRQKSAQKRHAFHMATSFDEKMRNDGWPGNLETLSDALSDLESRDPERAMLVDLRFFFGLSMDQAAQVLGISPATAKRQWRWTKAWLYKYLKSRDEALAGAARTPAGN